MKTVVDIRRTDLLKFQIYMLPRIKANWIFFFVIVGTVFVWALYDLPGPVTARKVLIAALTALAAAIGGTLAGVLCSIVLILMSSSLKVGVLGEHRFEIRPEGFFEETRANEQLNRWAGITAVGRTNSFIYVRINWYLFHLIPRRSFSEDSEYEQFFQDLQSKWRDAAA
jgi:YcxB-like protein